MYRVAGADVCRNIDCTVVLVVGPLLYVAAVVVTLKRA